MPRVYRKAKSKRPEVNPAVWSWLCDENPDEVDEERNFSRKIFELHGEWINSRGGNGDQLKTLWQEVESDVLAYFIAEHPGTRPARWWWYSAPRSAPGGDAYLDGRLAEPRLQVSGAGGPPWGMGFAHVPWLEYGIPTSWSALTRRTRRSSKAKRTICGVTDCSPHMNCGLSRQKISSPNARRFQTIKF